jgi:hypothetical protein
MHEVFYDDRRAPFLMDLAANQFKIGNGRDKWVAERIEVPVNACPRAAVMRSIQF